MYIYIYIHIYSHIYGGVCVHISIYMYILYYLLILVVCRKHSFIPQLLSEPLPPGEQVRDCLRIPSEMCWIDNWGPSHGVIDGHLHKDTIGYIIPSFRSVIYWKLHHTKEWRLRKAHSSAIQCSSLPQAEPFGQL